MYSVSPHFRRMMTSWLTLRGVVMSVETGIRGGILHVRLGEGGDVQVLEEGPRVDGCGLGGKSAVEQEPARDNGGGVGGWIGWDVRS